MEDDDFARRVYCILGVPIDDIDVAGVVDRIHGAALTRKHLFLSTPNLNYLMLSQKDAEFRRSLLQSDLCPADGMGAVKPIPPRSIFYIRAGEMSRRKGSR